MTNPPANPPPLPKETFYAGVRTYRNWRTFGMVAGVSLTSLPFVLGVYNHLTHRGTGNLPVSVAYIVAAFFLFGLFNVISKSVRNVRETFEIDSDGVRSKHNFWYWTQVKSLTPQKVNFESKYYIRAGLKVDPRVCILVANEALTTRQYAEFLGRVKPFLDANHPTIELKGPAR